MQCVPPADDPAWATYWLDVALDDVDLYGFASARWQRIHWYEGVRITDVRDSAMVDERYPFYIYMARLQRRLSVTPPFLRDMYGDAVFVDSWAYCQSWFDEVFMECDLYREQVRVQRSRRMRDQGASRLARERLERAEAERALSEAEGGYETLRAELDSLTARFDQLTTRCRALADMACTVLPDISSSSSSRLSTRLVQFVGTCMGLGEEAEYQRQGE